MENTTIIIHNDNLEIELLHNIFKNFKLNFNNRILDTKELFCLLEPHFNSYELNYLLKNTLTDFNIENSMYLTTNLIKLLNKILEKNNIGDFLNYSLYLKDWIWLEYLTSYNLNEEVLKPPKEYNKIFFHNNSPNIIINLKNNCEECLKDETNWKKLNSKYKFRISQFEVMKNVRKSLEQESFSIIEAPTGTGKSISYCLPAINEALNGKKIFISTNTKELQSQLISKDIPFLLSAFDLKGKLNYLLLKGKRNYLCIENIKNILSTHSLLNSMTIKEKLGLVFLDRYTNLGLAGDYEEIPYYVTDKFKLSSLISLCTCDSDGCDIKHCKFNCFYKNTIENLKETNLIILNHSLLLKWPYDINIENVIIDEAHNLSDSIFDAYANTINSLDIISLLKEILDYDNKKGYLSYLWKYIKNKEANA
ncbi:MAG: DEAD/DEAH box helicase, partial [Sarcina sp.]